LLAVAAYAGSLKASVAWDDIYLIGSNPAIRTLATPWRFVVDPWSHSLGAGDNHAQYRPLRAVLFAVEYGLFDGQVWGFHLVSILLHGLSAAILGLLTHALFDRGGWFAATLWLVHPALSENVLYLAAQGNLLCVNFSLLALLAHLRWLEDRSPWRRAGALAASLAAMASYEFGALLPVLFLLVEAVRSWQGQRLPGSLLRRHLPYWVALAAFVALRTAIVEPMAPLPWWEGSWTTALVLQLRIWVEAWRLTVLPLDQRPLYLPPDIPAFASAPVAVVAHLVLAALVIHAVVTRRHRLAAASIVWWYVAQAPTSNIIVSNPGFMFAPRFMFLALVLPLAAFSAWLAGRPRRRAAIGALSAAAVLALPLDWRQVAVWQDSLSLNRSIVARNPDDFGGLQRLGTTLFLCGDEIGARRALEAAHSLFPEWAATNLLLGELYLRDGEMRAAHAAFSAAGSDGGTYEVARLRLAEVAIRAHEPAAAREWLAIVGPTERLDTFRRIRAELTLARLELALGDLTRVTERVERALAAAPPTATALFEGGVLLTYVGRRERGRELLASASELAGRELTETVGDVASLGPGLLRPSVPLTPPALFASFCVPLVGP
jgi:Flp pilus assembly protein TadD